MVLQPQAVLSSRWYEGLGFTFRFRDAPPAAWGCEADPDKFMWCSTGEHIAAGETVRAHLLSRALSC